MGSAWPQGKRAKPFSERDLEQAAPWACNLLRKPMITRGKCAIICVAIAALCTLYSSAPARAQLPVLEVRLEQETARVGEPYRVVYETSWSGTPDDFRVLPTEPEPVSWAASRSVGAEGAADGAKFFVTQTVEYVPNEAGEFEVPPFVVSYFDPALVEDSESLSEEAEGEQLPEQQTIRAAGFTVTVKSDLGRHVIYWTALALFAALSAAGVWKLTRRRRARLEGASVGVAEPQTARSALNLARQHRLDGKFYEFYRELSRAAALFAPSGATRKLREKLEADAKEVGYRGVRPTDDDMDGALKDLERAMQGGPGDDG